MNDEGYTLVEMLAALLIIGLAVGGLSQAMRVIGLTQSATARAISEERERQTIDRRLETLLDHRGPFISDETDDAAGRQDEFTFDCGKASPCGVRLSTAGKDERVAIGSATPTVLAKTDDLGLIYGGDLGSSETWPPASSQRQTLHWLAVVSGSRDQLSPVAVARLWREEAPDCVFDLISQACRAPAP